MPDLTPQGMTLPAGWVVVSSDPLEYDFEGDGFRVSVAFDPLGESWTYVVANADESEVRTGVLNAESAIAGASGWMQERMGSQWDTTWLPEPGDSCWLACTVGDFPAMTPGVIAEVIGDHEAYNVTLGNALKLTPEGTGWMVDDPWAETIQVNPFELDSVRGRPVTARVAAYEMPPEENRFGIENDGYLVDYLREIRRLEPDESKLPAPLWDQRYRDWFQWGVMPQDLVDGTVDLQWDDRLASDPRTQPPGGGTDAEREEETIEEMGLQAGQGYRADDTGLPGVTIARAAGYDIHNTEEMNWPDDVIAVLVETPEGTGWQIIGPDNQLLSDGDVIMGDDDAMWIAWMNTETPLPSNAVLSRRRPMRTATDELNTVDGQDWDFNRDCIYCRDGVEHSEHLISELGSGADSIVSSRVAEYSDYKALKEIYLRDSSVTAEDALDQIYHDRPDYAGPMDEQFLRDKLEYFRQIQLVAAYQPFQSDAPDDYWDDNEDEDTVIVPESCPLCGAEVPEAGGMALECDECGAVWTPNRTARTAAIEWDEWSEMSGGHFTDEVQNIWADVDDDGSWSIVIGYEGEPGAIEEEGLAGNPMSAKIKVEDIINSYLQTTASRVAVPFGTPCSECGSTDLTEGPDGLKCENCGKLQKTSYANPDGSPSEREKNAPCWVCGGEVEHPEADWGDLQVCDAHKNDISASQPHPNSVEYTDRMNRASAADYNPDCIHCRQGTEHDEHLVSELPEGAGDPGEAPYAGLPAVGDAYKSPKESRRVQAYGWDDEGPIGYITSPKQEDMPDGWTVTDYDDADFPDYQFEGPYYSALIEAQNGVPVSEMWHWIFWPTDGHPTEDGYAGSVEDALSKIQTLGAQGQSFSSRRATNWTLDGVPINGGFTIEGADEADDFDFDGDDINNDDDSVLEDVEPKKSVRVMAKRAGKMPYSESELSSAPSGVYLTYDPEGSSGVVWVGPYPSEEDAMATAQAVGLSNDARTKKVSRRTPKQRAQQMFACRQRARQILAEDDPTKDVDESDVESVANWLIDHLDEEPWNKPPEPEDDGLPPEGAVDVVILTPDVPVLETGAEAVYIMDPETGDVIWSSDPTAEASDDSDIDDDGTDDTADEVDSDDDDSSGDDSKEASRLAGYVVELDDGAYLKADGEVDSWTAMSDDPDTATQFSSQSEASEAGHRFTDYCKNEDGYSFDITFQVREARYSKLAELSAWYIRDEDTGVTLAGPFEGIQEAADKVDAMEAVDPDGTFIAVLMDPGEVDRVEGTDDGYTASRKTSALSWSQEPGGEWVATPPDYMKYDAEGGYNDEFDWDFRFDVREEGGTDQWMLYGVWTTDSGGEMDELLDGPFKSLEEAKSAAQDQADETSMWA